MTAKLDLPLKKFSEAIIIDSEKKNILEEIEQLAEYAEKLDSEPDFARLYAGLIKISISHLKNHFADYSSLCEKHVVQQ